jgi:hypothetical protein
MNEQIVSYSQAVYLSVVVLAVVVSAVVVLAVVVLHSGPFIWTGL